MEQEKEKEKESKRRAWGRKATVSWRKGKNKGKKTYQN